VRLSGKILKSFLFLWAAAILWIYIGSLINFHQHKIWGRPLLPQLIYAKRDKEQSVEYNNLLKQDLPKDINPDNINNFIGIIAFKTREFDCLTSSSSVFSATDPIPLERLISCIGLRAPPLS
jgi:hypothetical protein